MRADWDAAARHAQAAVNYFQGCVVQAAENTSIYYEDIIAAESKRLTERLIAIDEEFKLPPGQALAMALLRVGVRV